MKEIEGNTNLKIAETVSAAVRERIVQALQGIRFGAVEIIIHDGKVVQIERKERLRLETH